MPEENDVQTVPPWERVRFRSAGEIGQHPEFDAACACLGARLLTLYGDDLRLIRRLNEFVPAVTFMMIVCLDALEEPDDPSTHVTLDRLRAALAEMGIADPRRIANLVLGMERDGFLTREAAPYDRRVRLLRPTERMLAIDREWLAAFHAPLALMYPEDPVYRAAVMHDRAYQSAYRKVSLTTVGFAKDIVGGNPPVAFFLSHDGGIRVLMALLETVRDRGSLTIPRSFYVATAARTGLSRTHVRNLIVAAADLALVRLADRSERGVAAEVRPVLLDATRQWIADSLSGTDLVCSLARSNAAMR